MCLTSKYDIPKTTEQSIIVYKVLDENMRTPFYNFKYEIGKLYHDESEEDIGEAFDHYLIGAGYFHSHTDLDEAKNMCRICNKYEKHKYSVYEAEIPENTLYIQGLRKDICSKSLKIIKKCIN